MDPWYVVLGIAALAGALGTVHYRDVAAQWRAQWNHAINQRDTARESLAEARRQRDSLLVRLKAQGK